MKIFSLKSKIATTLFLLLMYQSVLAQNASENLKSRIEKNDAVSSKLATSSQNSNRLLPPVITGNFSICLPGPTTTQLTASVPPAPITATTPWFSLNTAVATIDSSGLVTQVSFGTTTITYTDNLGNTYSENVYVSPFPSISTPNGTSTCAGGTLQIDGSLFPNALTPWTSLNPAIASVDSSGLITGITGGIATIQYMNLGGCTITTPITINPPLIPTVTCGATTTDQITFNWTAVAGAATYVRSYQVGAGPFQLLGSSSATTYTLTGLLPSTTVTFYVAPSGSVGGCFQVGQVTCSTQACNAATTPAAPTIGVITPPSCALATGSVAISGLPAGNWTLNQAGTSVNSIAGNTASTTISGLAPGNYTFTVTNNLGCTSVVSVNVNIPIQPVTPAVPTIGAITPPTCALATGSVDISGLPAGNWTLNQSGTAVNAIAGNTVSTTISGLVAGNYTFTVTNADGCTSLASVNVPIPIQPITPATPTIGAITPPTCALATGSVVISGLPAGNWTLNQSGTAVNSIAGNTASTTISGLVAGNYTFTVTNSVGCTSLVSVNVPIPIQPVTPAIPIIGTITPPTCALATGSVDISSLPAGNWTLNQSGTAVNSIAGNTVSTTISGLVAGNYTFTVTNSVGCTSLVSVNVPIPVQPITPAIPTIGAITPPTCALATGSVIISGLPAGNWTLNQSGTAGNAIAGNTTSTTISGLVAGNYTFTVTNSVGCTSLVSVNVPIPIQPVTPAIPTIGTITPPTCALATGSVDISGLPAGNWTLNQSGTVANAIIGNTLVTTVSGLIAGSYTFTVTNADGCTSLVSVNVPIPVQPITPAAPTTTSLTNSITECQQSPLQTLDANSIIIPVGNNTIWFSQATGGIPIATPILNSIGNVTYYAQANNGFCDSLTRTPVTLTIVGAPAAPTTTSITNSIVECRLATIQTLDANSIINQITGQTFTWFDDPTVGNLVANPTLNTINTITYYAVANLGTCSSLTRTAVTLTINATPNPPVAGPDIFQCEQSPLQTITATATVSSGETVIWYDAPNAGAVVVPPSINTAISVVYFAEAFDGTCASLTRTPVILTINALPADPVVGLLTQPDCITPTGSITIFPVPAGISYSFDNGPYTTTTFYGLLPSGTNHTIIAKNTGGCLSQPIVVSILPQPTTPNAPTVVITQPTCTVPTGAITINGVVGETYSFDSGPFTSQLVYNGLLAASTHTLKTKNTSGCISTTTSITLNIQPLTPAPPTLTPIQPTCTVSTGTVQIANVLGQTYSFNGSPFNATLNYSGLSAGSTHTVTAKNGSGCISAASTITLDIQPPTPNAPAIFAAQPDCTEALGEITILNVAGETYSFDGGPYVSNLIYSDLAAGTYTITATNSFSCISPSTTVTIIPQPITVTPPITDGVICVDEATGVPFRTHILETGLNLATHSFVWTLDGAIFPETGSSIEVVTPGVYTVVATNISTGCDSAIATATITESFPGLGIAAQVINQFSNEAGIIVNVNTGTGPFIYQLDNGPSQESNLFSPVLPGSHVVHVTDVNGCTDLTSEVTVLGYLKFFTPNDDTFTDTWNIIGLEGQPEAIIHIYDRYGKYIKQISANGKGWDGTSNGQPLPSTDYWFTVEYIENGQSKEFKSHFSLVR